MRLGSWNKVVLSTVFHAKIAMLNIFVKRDELFIEQAKNGIANRDNGMTLPEVYKPIVRNWRFKNN